MLIFWGVVVFVFCLFDLCLCGSFVHVDYKTMSFKCFQHTFIMKLLICRCRCSHLPGARDHTIFQSLWLLGGGLKVGGEMLG